MKRVIEKLLTKVEKDEVYAELMQADEAVDECVTDHPGETYEHGVVATIQWMLGNSNHKPMTED